MRLLRSIGMILFLGATALLVTSLFLNEYQYSDQVLSRAIAKKEERTVLKPVLDPLKTKKYHFSFSFNKEIELLLQRANLDISREFSLTDQDIGNVISQFSGRDIAYDNERIANAFDSTREGRFKARKLKEYTSWMNNREYDNSLTLKEHLEQSRREINAAIINEKGFNDYKIKTIKLAITRHSSIGPVTEYPKLWLLLTVGLGAMGAVAFIVSQGRQPEGFSNNYIFRNSNTGRGWIGYIIGSLLIAFYVVLYWFPEYMTSWIIISDPISRALNGHEASQWFFYGLLYTLAVAVMGVRMLLKYRNSKYQKIRTYSVIFFQTAFAFLIPEILIRLNQPGMDMKNIWPLNYSFFFDYNIENLINSGSLGVFMLVWGIVLAVIAVPVFTYFYGKRWYCSWVCGCGGLAETLGDPYRQLSDKSLKAWKIERWMVHGVLVFAVVMTAGVLYTYFSGSSTVLGISTYDVRALYGFLIGAAFAGVVGVGFYPFMGNRVWCRFGCPLAAYIGIVQRFKSRFRITTNGGQCISCGNCSTYCEMGIDVRWYAQRGQNIVRASCVGCGVCAEVCPRGVLKLENKDPKGRI